MSENTTLLDPHCQRQKTGRIGFIVPKFDPWRTLL